MKAYSDISTEDLLSQATASVSFDGQIKGTAWLISHDGYLLTAGHILDGPHERITVQFAGDIPRRVRDIECEHDSETGVDYAILQLQNPLHDRIPLPITLAKAVKGEFVMLGFGETLVSRGTARGRFIGFLEPQNVSSNRLFKLDSKQAGEQGYSGSAVFSEEAEAVVAFQIEATKRSSGAERDTILAMPLYRIPRLEDFADTIVANAYTIEDDCTRRSECSGLIAKFEQRYLNIGHFGGRHQEMAKLNQWLEQTDDCNAILSGPVGIGKSALIAHWVELLRTRQNPDVVYHPISQLTETHQREVVLQSLVSQLMSVFSVYYPHNLDVVSLQSTLNNLLIDPPNLRRPLVVGVDGLDELDTMPEECIKFPQPTKGIHLLVTARMHDQQKSDDRLYWKGKLGWEDMPSTYLHLDSLDKKSVADVVRRADLVDDPDKARALTTKLQSVTEGYPLLLGLFLAMFEDQNVTVEAFLKQEIKPGTKNFVEETEARLKEDDAYDQDFLGFLTAALGPMYSTDLRYLGIQSSNAELNEISRHSRGLIVGDAEREGFALSHPKIGYIYAEENPKTIKCYGPQYLNGQRPK